MHCSKGEARAPLSQYLKCRFMLPKGGPGRQVTNVSRELTRWRTNRIGTTSPIATPVIPFNQPSFLVQSSGKCPYLRPLLPLGVRPISHRPGPLSRTCWGSMSIRNKYFFRPKATARKAGSAGLLSTSKLSNGRAEFPSFAFARELCRDRVQFHSRSIFNGHLSCRNGSGGRKRPERKHLTKAAGCGRRV
jgi:hypothetical protein